MIPPCGSPPRSEGQEQHGSKLALRSCIQYKVGIGRVNCTV